MKFLISFFKLLNYLLAVATFLAYAAPYISPSNFWPLIFFGLAYPAFLVGNLLFIGFWFFIKKRLIWISAVTILLGIGHIPKIVGFNFSKKEQAGTTKIMTLNAANFFQFWKKGKFKKEGIDAFYTFLKKEKPQISCFQEFHGPTAQKLNSGKNAFFKFSENKNKRILIGSNDPIKASGKLQFENLITNGISWADLETKEGIVRIYSLHLKSNQVSTITNKFNFSENFLSKDGLRYLRQVMPLYKNAAIKRIEMVEKLKKHLADCPYPVVICGDLNDPPLSYTYQKISEGLKDTFVEKGFGWGKTYNGKIPGLRIDYIFVSPEIEVVDFRIVKKDYSDHYPLICNLKLKQN